MTPSWDEFLTEFKSIFGDPDPASSARYKMNHLKQGAMTCDEYVSAFRALVTESGLNDTALVEKFENGLNSGLIDKIYNLPEMLVTLKGWMTWACKLDRQWRKRTGNRLNRSAVPTVSERLTKPSSATPKSSQDMGMGVGLSQSTAQASRCLSHEVFNSGNPTGQIAVHLLPLLVFCMSADSAPSYEGYKPINPDRRELPSGWVEQWDNQLVSKTFPHAETDMLH